MQKTAFILEVNLFKHEFKGVLNFLIVLINNLKQDMYNKNIFDFVNEFSVIS